MGKTRDDTLHLRLDSEFKAQIEAAANRLDIPVAAYARMALREYIERHGLSRLNERGTGYTATAPSTAEAGSPAAQQALTAETPQTPGASRP